MFKRALPGLEESSINMKRMMTAGSSGLGLPMN